MDSDFKTRSMTIGNIRTTHNNIGIPEEEEGGFEDEECSNISPEFRLGKLNTSPFFAKNISEDVFNE